jgi:hypothetical protein
MSDLDERLRLSGDRWRGQQPPAPPVDERLIAARRQKPRRWVVATTGMAAALVVIAGVIWWPRSSPSHTSLSVTPTPSTLASTAPPTTVAAGVVPWISTTAPPFDAGGPPTTTSTFVPAPPCQALHLRGSAGQEGAAAGTLRLDLQFTNTGSSTCALSGTPTVQGRNAAGRLVAVPSTPGELNNFGPAVDVPGGDTVILTLASSDFNDACPNQASFDFSGLEIGLPQHGGVVSLPGSRFTGNCRAIVSTFGYISPAPAPPAPGTAGTLTAALDPPPSVAVAGTTLRYVIALANPTSVDVVLHECPGYSESVSQLSGGIIEQKYLLNCAAAGTIPAGAQVRFAMEFPLPASLPAGTAKLSWQLHVLDGTAAGSAIVVQRN